jgi:hypothetical protein
MQLMFKGKEAVQSIIIEEDVLKLSRQLLHFKHSCQTVAGRTLGYVVLQLLQKRKDLVAIDKLVEDTTEDPAVAFGS